MVVLRFLVMLLMGSLYTDHTYSDPWNNNSDIGLATSSYRVKSEEAENRPSYGDSQQNPPAGALMADWECRGSW